MIAFLRIALVAVLGLVLILVGGGLFFTKESASTSTPQTPSTPTVQETLASSSVPVAMPLSVTTKPATTTQKKPAPVPPIVKPPGVLTPGTPEYQKSLQDAIDALARLHASVGPATSLNDSARKALVNIHCTAKSAGAFNITGSGIIMDPKGVIVTNSHIAQFFLLKNYPTPGSLTCVIRTGSPAYPTYTAELLFMPPSWMAANAQKIKEQEPKGNGEHDYAFLRITGSVNPSTPLPASFPYLPPSYNDPSEGTTVLVAGYAAGFLGGAEVAKNLYASSSYVKIGEIFTYGNNTADVFSLGGSIVAQQGSSGGAVANENGNLVGVVVTSTITADTASRDLKALSFSYIAEDFVKENGMQLVDFLASDLAQKASSFNAGIAPTLTKTLTDILSQP